jgi:DNA-binding NarL/FixJ family response regulator
MLAKMPSLKNVEVENAIRLLIEASGGVSDEPQAMFEVRVDGQQYVVSIVQPDALYPSLSPRERDIAQLIAKGLPTKIIATRLGLRPCTVSTYTKRIYLKLNVNSRAEMVAKMLSQPSPRFYPLRSRDSEDI